MSAHRLSWMKRYPLLGPLFGLSFVLLLFEGMIYGHRTMNFLSPDTIGLIVTQTTVVATGTLGMTMIIVSGGIDLSAGSVVALTGVIAAVTPASDGHSSWVAVAAAIFIGGLVGFVNGGIIARFKMMPFIVTLGAMGAMRGLAKWIGDNQTVNYNLGPRRRRQRPDEQPLRPPRRQRARRGGNPATPASASPASSPTGSSTCSAISWRPTASTPATSPSPSGCHPSACSSSSRLTILMSLVLNRSVFGRHIFALGSNEDTARLCGLRTRTLKVLVYTLAGCFIGLAGVFDLARLSQGDVTVGQGLELDIIAAVVIGGASLNGGVGSIWGAIIGALTMTSLRSGTVQMGWPSYIQEIIIGVVIVLAVGVDKIRSRGLKG